MIYGTRSDLSIEEASISFYNIDNQVFEDVLHRHDRDEIVLVTNGTGIFQIGSSEGAFGPGTVAYVRSGALHFWNSECEANNPTPVSALIVHVPREVLSKTFLELREASGVKSFLDKLGDGAFTRLSEYQRIEARLRTILGARGMLRIARTHALMDLLSKIANWQVVDNKKLKENKGEDLARLKRVYQFLGANFRSPVSRSRLAELVGMEPNSFSRFFHRASGQRLSDYIAVIRVRHAAIILGSRRRMPVSMVARESGFQNLSAFNRQFKKRLGVTPRLYRKQLNAEPIQP